MRPRRSGCASPGGQEIQRGAEHLRGVAPGQRPVRTEVGAGADVAGIEVRHGLGCPVRHVRRAEGRGRGVGELQKGVEHHGGLRAGDGGVPPEHGPPAGLRAALHHAVEKSCGDIGLLPESDVTVVIKAGAGHVLQRGHPRKGGAHGEEIAPGEGGRRVEAVAATHLFPGENAFFRQTGGGVLERAALQLRIRNRPALLFDADGDAGVRRDVAFPVHRLIGETVPAPGAVLRRVDEAVPLRGDGALPRFHGHPEAEGIPLRVHRLKASAHGNAPIGGQAQVPGHRRAVVPLHGADDYRLHLHRRGGSRQQRETKQQRRYGSDLHKTKRLP